MGQNRKAFEDGVTILDAANLNSILQMQDGALICSGGTLIDSKTGAGVTENSLADNNYAIRITATGQTEIGYINLKVDADGTGQDLMVSLVDSTFATDGSNNGVVKATRLVPKEFIATSAGMVLIPFALDGLTSGANYWLIVSKSGDATNKLDLVGEASQDAAHPVYRRAGTSGAWTISNAIHFEVYSWSIDGDVLAAVDGGQWDWLEYNAGDLVKIKSYTPGTTGAGLREIMDLTNASGTPKKWVVT